MLNELFEALFSFSKTNNFLVNTLITKTCYSKNFNWAYGTHLGSILSFKRIEGDNLENIPAISEGEENQG